MPPRAGQQQPFFGLKVLQQVSQVEWERLPSTLMCSAVQQQPFSL